MWIGAKITKHTAGARILAFQQANISFKQNFVNSHILDNFGRENVYKETDEVQPCKVLRLYGYFLL